MEVGKLTFKEFKGVPYAQGHIETEAFSGRIVMGPQDQRTQNSPNWKIKRLTNAGKADCGAAWTKTSDKVKGGEFYSITIDTPMMVRPLYLTAFPADDQPADEDGVMGDEPTEYVIIWKRPRAGGVPSRSERATRAPQITGGQDLDDEIPF